MNISCTFEIIKILSATDSQSGDWRILRALVRGSYDGNTVISPVYILSRKELAEQLPIGVTNLMVSGTISSGRKFPRLTIVIESALLKKA